LSIRATLSPWIIFSADRSSTPFSSDQIGARRVGENDPEQSFLLLN
jgi:hypothetical protein